MKKIAYRPFSFQRKFQESTKPNVYLSGGYGSGKTYSLVMKMFALMNMNIGLPGGILAPSLKMYKRDVYPTIKAICAANSIRHSYNKSEMVWWFPDAMATIYVFHSEDDGASIRGPNLAWGVINEVTLISKPAFLAFVGRVRLKAAKLLQLAMSGTPEGFNWTYEYFVENPREDTEMIFGNTRENVHNAESYVGRLESSYDPLMQMAYIDGKFVNLNARPCAWAFDRHKHTREGIDKIHGHPVLVSLDFNVAPMAATLWNHSPWGMHERTGDPMGYTLRAFDELAIESSNTWELCQELKSRLDPFDDVTIYPDPAGVARSTKSNFSDFDILKKEGFTNLKYKTKLSVKDCLNALNGALSKNLIVLNSKKCRNTIADLEQCVFKQGVFEIDKKNPRRTHWLDGTKNMLDMIYPAVKPTGSREEMIR